MVLEVDTTERIVDYRGTCVEGMQYPECFSGSR